MPNNLDAEMYPDNNSLVVCRPVRKSIDVTGAEIEAALTGLTDLRCFLSLAANDDLPADAINANLNLLLTEEGATGVYHGVMLGQHKRAHIASATGTAIYAHWYSASAGYHEVSRAIWRLSRPAASA